MTDFTKVQFDLQYSDHLNTYYESKAQAIKDKQEFLKIEFMGNLEESVKYFDQYPALKFRKRVMIMMSDTGGGHRASAEALEDAFSKLYPGGWPSLVFNLRGLVEGPREPPGASFPAFRTLTKVAIARWGSQARLSAISLTCGQTTRAGRIMRSCPFTSSCRSTPTRGASFGDTVRGGYRGHRQRQPASARATRERRLVRQG